MIKIKVEEIRDDFDLYYSRYGEAFNHVRELADDIRIHGLKDPIEVHKIEGGYEVVEGVHRFKAILLLKWKEVECIIVNHGPHITPRPRNRYGEPDACPHPPMGTNVVKSGDIF